MRKKFKPGVTFGDFIVHDSAVKKTRVDSSVPADYRRGWLAWMMVVVLFAILGVRLVGLQLFYGGRYRTLADENRIKTIKLPAPRGEITDRNGRVLAVSQKTSAGWVRQYPLGANAAQVVGYVSQVNADEVGLLKDAGEQYDIGDMMGRTGVEQVYEKSLRGQDGGRLVEVDHEGREVRELGRRNPIPGQGLKLSVDANLQMRATEAMAGKKGAVIASNPQTGEVLALVSSPSFDPNLISTDYAKYAVDANLPMFDRAIGAIYPPGSTFKMTVTAAAITDKKVDPNFTFLDQGIIRVGSFSYTNWLYSRGGGTEGTIGFARAITRSTDTFFYKIGELTGPDTIAKWARAVGMGAKTGIDLPGEVAGLIPTPDWKLRVKGEEWFLGDTYHMAIGQGDVLVTPLQINLMTNVMATAGKKCRLHMTAAGKVSCSQVPIDPVAVGIIHQGMVGACSPGGTAFPIFDWNEAAAKGLAAGTFAKSMDGQPLPLVACKTGTAEYVAADGKTHLHGWLTAYAPADNPTISVTVVMEGGGEGSNVAAPVVRQVLAKYFNVTDTYPYQNIPQQISE